jgi:hypothetical protein
MIVFFGSKFVGIFVQLFFIDHGFRPYFYINNLKTLNHVYHL